MKKLHAAKKRLYCQRRIGKNNRNKRRRLRLLRTSLRRFEQRRELIHRFGPQSKILQLMSEQAPRQLHVKDGINIIVPKVFSIIDEPKVVLDLVSNFAAVRSSGARPSRVYVDQSRMKKYDLAASALLDLIAVELKKEQYVNNRKVGFEGRFEKYGPVARFIKAIGIVKHLGIKSHTLRDTERRTLKVFDRRNRHYSRPTSAKTSSRKDRAASGFVDHINACLEVNGTTLTGRGVTQLSGCIGEMLDNAEEHAEFIDWSMLGYLDLEHAESKVEIAIFNFGRSIAQTFLDLPPEHFTWKHVRPYVQRHLGKGPLLKPWKKEELITVMALQEHVSSKNYSESTDRGHGTIQLLRFFNKIHEACNGSRQGAEMALVSGSTYIRFDGTHLLAEGVDNIKTIAFNRYNSLLQPPNDEYVQRLESVFFPGTIISIRFPLTARMVQED